MLTLTYKHGVEWNGCHISSCIRLIRQWLKRRNIQARYVWVAEIQEKRKARHPDFHCVHYHIVIWLPWGIELPFLDDQGWWPYGMTKVEWAKCAVGYVSKYVSKGDASYRLPKGARMYGVGGLSNEALDEARWWALPSWLRAQVHQSQTIRRRSPGGGWLDRDTGELFFSPWRVLIQGGTIWIYRTDLDHACLVSHAKPPQGEQP
jgi:hypothetical protein